jgi:hypothetical protein
VVIDFRKSPGEGHGVREPRHPLNVLSGERDPADDANQPD